MFGEKTNKKAMISAGLVSGLIPIGIIALIIGLIINAEVTGIVVFTAIMVGMLGFVVVIAVALLALATQSIYLKLYSKFGGDNDS